MFDYTFTRSVRSKSFKLKISLEKGLEVVGPREPSARMVKGMFLHNEGWIRSNLERLKYMPKPKDPLDALPPEKIQFPCGDLCYTAQMREPALVARVKEQGETLYITPDENGLWQDALSKWVNKRVPSILTPMLEEIIDRTGLKFARTQYRNQKTRWASCSTTGTISMNRSLVFLSEPLVRYVMIHELCHTIHMDHSQDFWDLVGTHDPFYKSLDAELKTARADFVPDWYC